MSTAYNSNNSDAGHTPSPPHFIQPGTAQTGAACTALDPVSVAGHVFEGLCQCFGAGGLFNGHNPVPHGSSRGRIEDHDVATLQLQKCLGVIAGSPDAEGCCAADAEQDHPCSRIVAVIDVLCKTPVRGGVPDDADRKLIISQIVGNTCGAAIRLMGWRWLLSLVMLGDEGHRSVHYQSLKDGGQGSQGQWFIIAVELRLAKPEGRCVAIEDESLWAWVHAGRSLRIVHVLGFFLYFLKDFDLFVNADGVVDPKTGLVN